MNTDEPLSWTDSTGRVLWRIFVALPPKPKKDVRHWLCACNRCNQTHTGGVCPACKCTEFRVLHEVFPDKEKPK